MGKKTASRNQIKTLDRYCLEAYQTATEKGWWQLPRHFLELLCLIHMEVSEAGEAYRRKEPDQKVLEELADVVIRIFDVCGHNKWDLQRAIDEKMEYNKHRPYRHGGKRC